MGPKPMSDGCRPTEAQEIIFANGLIDLFFASSNVINNNAAAPSFIPEEFPAVTVPFSLKTVFNFCKSDNLILTLGCSSILKIVSFLLIATISS